MRIIFVYNSKCMKTIQNKVLRANAGKIHTNLDHEGHQFLLVLIYTVPYYRYILFLITDYPMSHNLSTQHHTGPERP